jgi:hypothetical protein
MNTAVDTLVAQASAQNPCLGTTNLDAKFRGYDTDEVKRI